MKRIILVILAACATPVATSAQRPPANAETGANLPARAIGINDLLSITVYGAPELSRSVRVSAEGLIRLPMLGERVTARGLMPAELETRLADSLSGERILVDPVVTVNIAEYGSRPVSVAGAVRHPLTFEVFRQITLLDALARAEGLSTDAGGEILVTRPAADASSKPLVERVSVRDLIEAANPAANLALTGGEEVRVPEARRVFVVGNVRKPGAFRMESSAMTVLQALAISEGLAPFSAKEAFIYRPADGGTKAEVPVHLRQIMERKSPDVALQAGDIFYIPDNRRGRVTATAIERALAFAVGTASGAIVFSASR